MRGSVPGGSGRALPELHTVYVCHTDCSLSSGRASDCRSKARGRRSGCSRTTRRCSARVHPDSARRDPKGPLDLCVGEAEVRHGARSAAEPRTLNSLRNAGTDDLTPEHVRVCSNSELRAANLTAQRQVIVLSVQRRRHIVDSPRTETVRNRKRSSLNLRCVESLSRRTGCAPRVGAMRRGCHFRCTPPIREPLRFAAGHTPAASSRAVSYPTVNGICRRHTR
jgi:hypothetical protein